MHERTGRGREREKYIEWVGKGGRETGSEGARE